MKHYALSSPTRTLSPNGGRRGPGGKRVSLTEPRSFSAAQVRTANRANELVLIAAPLHREHHRESPLLKWQMLRGLAP
jgi:hypothetical protein